MQKFRPEEKMKFQNSQKVAGQGDDGNKEVARSVKGDRNTNQENERQKEAMKMKRKRMGKGD